MALRSQMITCSRAKKLRSTKGGVLAVNHALAHRAILINQV
jgi:hypothetical protein